MEAQFDLGMNMGGVSLPALLTVAVLNFLRQFHFANPPCMGHKSKEMQMRLFDYNEHTTNDFLLL